MERERFWIKYDSLWTKQEKIASFDDEKEALWFKDQVKGEILPWGGGERLIKKLNKEVC